MIAWYIPGNEHEIVYVGIMIQVYKEAFKARATSLRARRVVECFKGPYKRVSYAIFYYT
jgi:hypothetical protein